MPRGKRTPLVAEPRVWTPLDAQRKERFLELLAEGNTAAYAARQCGIRRTTAYEARKTDPDFAAAWDIALEDGIQVLEQEARRRAVEGVTKEKGIYHQGQHIATETITEYSDSLLMFMLKAKRPEVYRDRAEVKHTGQVNHAHAHLDLTTASTDEIRAFIAAGRRLLGDVPAGGDDPR